MSRSRTTLKIHIAAIDNNSDSEVEELEAEVADILSHATHFRQSILQEASTVELAS